MKPIRLQSNLASKKCTQVLVLVHPIPNAGGWAYSLFDGNGQYTSTVTNDNSWTMKEAQGAARKHRQYLRRLHKQNVAKWSKK